MSLLHSFLVIALVVVVMSRLAEYVIYVPRCYQCQGKGKHRPNCPFAKE